MKNRSLDLQERLAKSLQNLHKARVLYQTTLDGARNSLYELWHAAGKDFHLAICFALSQGYEVILYSAEYHEGTAAIQSIGKLDAPDFGYISEHRVAKPTHRIRLSAAQTILLKRYVPTLVS